MMTSMWMTKTKTLEHGFTEEDGFMVKMVQMVQMVMIRMIRMMMRMLTVDPSTENTKNSLHGILRSNQTLGTI